MRNGPLHKIIQQEGDENFDDSMEVEAHKKIQREAKKMQQKMSIWNKIKERQGFYTAEKKNFCMEKTAAIIQAQSFMYISPLFVLIANHPNPRM